MKRTILFSLLFLAMGSPAGANTDAGTKLGRGLNNVAFGWFDIPNEMGEQSDVHGPLIGMPAGLVRGAASGAVRTLTGVYEVVTFLLPNGSKGYEPLIRPASSLSRDQ